MDTPLGAAPVILYDTTLRDGTQGENITLSLADKIRIARMLDEYGMPYIEGGWPGSNPKDIEFFAAARTMTWQQRGAVALGSAAFLAFGGTDLLEIGCAGRLPSWLWGLKIACGCAILVARYTYRGWRTFRWTDREFLFGLALLAGVAIVLAVQWHAEHRTS